jgi:hypothetical protein
MLPRENRAARRMAEWRTGSINLMAGTDAMQHAMVNRLACKALREHDKNIAKALQQHGKALQGHDPSNIH